ncbi:unnamed protein product, partial [marine sediment metagenome]
MKLIGLIQEEIENYVSETPDELESIIKDEVRIQENPDNITNYGDIFR